MKHVFLVGKDVGEYSDHSYTPLKVFTKKAKAEKYVSDLNKQWAKKYEINHAAEVRMAMWDEDFIRPNMVTRTDKPKMLVGQSQEDHVRINLEPFYKKEAEAKDLYRKWCDQRSKFRTKFIQETFGEEMKKHKLLAEDIVSNYGGYTPSYTIAEMELED